MARLFISCNNRDFNVGRRLERALERRKHVMTLRVNARPAGRWEGQLLQGVHTADAFICLLTPEGMASSWVVGQTGMAISCEYTKHTLVLPVCPPGAVPNFVAAFHCFWLTGTGPNAIEKLADELDEAIVAHQARRSPGSAELRPSDDGPNGSRAPRSLEPAGPGFLVSWAVDAIDVTCSFFLE